MAQPQEEVRLARLAPSLPPSVLSVLDEYISAILEAFVSSLKAYCLQQTAEELL